MAPSSATKTLPRQTKHTGPSHLLVLHVFGSDFHDYASYYLPRDQAEVDQPIVLFVPLFTLLEDRDDICFLLEHARFPTILLIQFLSP